MQIRHARLARDKTTSCEPCKRKVYPCHRPRAVRMWGSNRRSRSTDRRPALVIRAMVCVSKHDGDVKLGPLDAEAPESARLASLDWPTRLPQIRVSAGRLKNGLCGRVYIDNSTKLSSSCSSVVVARH